MYKERIYQREAAIKGIWSLTQTDHNNMIIGACGAGKSLIIAMIAKGLNAPVLVLQPTKEILEANFSKIQSYGIEGVALFSASVGKREVGDITYATIGSVVDFPEYFQHIRYVIIDELHVVNPASFKEGKDSMYANFFSQLKSPRFLGLTATPYRLINQYVFEKDQRGEIQKFYTTTLQTVNRIYPPFFKNIIYKVESEYLINKGYLCKPEYDLSYSKAFDYTNLRIGETAKDFDMDALEEFVLAPDRVKAVVAAAKDYDSQINRGLSFCTSLKHAKTCADLGKKWGLKTGYIDGTFTKKQRERTLAEFRNGDIKHLYNKGVLTTGADFPELDFEVFARPTVSATLWGQAVGRVIRKDPNNPDKKAIVVDACGVSLRLGRAETIKMAKEDVYKDIVVSEVGQLSGKMLSKFRMTKQETV